MRAQCVDYIIVCVIIVVVLRCLPTVADTKPAKPAIKSSTLPRTASQGKK